MRFGHLELATPDPAASMRYYVDVLGFELVANQADTFIWVKRDGTEILLRPQGDYPLPCVVYYSDDPERDAQRVGRPVERKGNCWHFIDADGTSTQIVDPEADHS